MLVELVSPAQVVWTGEAELVVARTVGGGDIAFLAGHAPFVGMLDAGTITIRPSGGGRDQIIDADGGFVEVSHDTVTILSDVAALRTEN